MEELHVIRNSTSHECDCYKRFVVSEELKKIGDKDVWKYMDKLYPYGGEKSEVTMYYKILWPHIARKKRGTQPLLLALPLLERLKKHVEEKKISKIIVGKGIPKLYKKVALVVSNEYSLEMEVCNPKHNETPNYNKLLSYISCLKVGLSMIVDVILGSLAKNESITKPNKIAAFPYPGREESLLPVVEFVRHKVKVYHPRYWISKVLYGETKKMANVGYSHFSEEGGFRLIYYILAGLVDMIKNIYTEKLYKDVLRQIKTEDEEAIKPILLEATKDLISKNARSVFTYYWAKHVFDFKDFEAVIVGGMHPRELAIINAAVDRNLDTHYVPHSITTGVETLPPPESTQFVASKIGKKYIEEVFKNSRLPSILCHGRPYFNEKLDISENSGRVSTENVVATIATGPFGDRVRKDYLVHLLPILNDKELIDEVQIKVHPSEDVGFYANVLSRKGLEVSRYSKKNLAQYLKSSSILFTIDSNIGIESVLMGNLCVCYNPFPFLYRPTPPYIRYSPIPVVTSKNELSEYISGVDEKRLRQIYLSQKKFLSSSYVKKGSAKKIALEVAPMNSSHMLNC